MSNTTLAIACDHGGLTLKKTIIAHLENNHPNLTINDLGTHTEDSVDYPDFSEKVVQSIQTGESESGILICGTGIGISIGANRHKGIRAALAYNAFAAEMAKAHNNANILCLGERTTDPEDAKTYVDTWLNTEFEGGRHQRRVDKLG